LIFKHNAAFGLVQAKKYLPNLRKGASSGETGNRFDAKDLALFWWARGGHHHRAVGLFDHPFAAYCRQHLYQFRI
jgi:hypothetical protein